MAVDIVPGSRRALLGVALGALAATGAHALGRPIAARAADGDPLLVGNGKSATAETQLTHSGLGIRSLYVLRSDVTSTGAAGAASTTVSRVSVATTTNTLTIHLTAATTSSVKVAWHVFG